jgi:uncharacterized membrane protein (UPF0127 family)
MKERIIFRSWLVIGIILILLFSYFFQNRIKIFFIEKENNFLKSYNFLLADTLEKRIQGLSGRDSFPPKTVMFFDFEKKDDCGIWMKDMKFSLDLLWLDDEFRVIDFKENISPSTFPEVFLPKSPCRYLIEAQEGFIKENAIQKGDKILVDFSNSLIFLRSSTK